MEEKNNYNLFNFDGMSEVANNLIDKLASATGWYVSRNTPSKIGLNTYIEEIQKKNYDPLTKAALITNAKKTIKEYCNQKDIVSIAINLLNKDCVPEMLDNDWLSIFMDKARLVTSEDFKLIWGKLLASECDNNGCVPKGLLHILSQIDREDAESFSTLCSLAIKVEDEYQPVVNINRFDDYANWGLDFDKLVNLKALGLIEMDFSKLLAYSICPKEIPIKAKYFNHEFECSKRKNQMKIGSVMFTKLGQALCKAITVNEATNFWDKYCLPFLKMYNI